ncbi:hypothetical protein [Alcanivorax sp.]|nr:hypothetical protein [Alcanivorax sp.]
MLRALKQQIQVSTTPTVVETRAKHQNANPLAKTAGDEIADGLLLFKG